MDRITYTKNDSDPRFLPAVTSGPYPQETKQTLAWLISYAAKTTTGLGDMAARPGVCQDDALHAKRHLRSQCRAPHLLALAALRARLTVDQAGEKICHLWKQRAARYTMDLARIYTALPLRGH